MLPGAALQVWLAAMATDARASTSPPQQQRRGERPQDEGKGKNLAWSRTEMTSMRQVARMDVLQSLGPALLSACSHATILHPPCCRLRPRFAEKQRQAAVAAAEQAEHWTESRPAAAAPPPQPAAETAQEERATLLKEQAAYVRAAMEAAQAERTRALVDSMWQSLE